MEWQVIAQPVVSTQPMEPKPAARNRSKLLPVLVFLLVAAYGIMTMVMVEQGNVISSQRYLIQQLFSDSEQLTALKGKEIARHALEDKIAKEQPQAQSQSESRQKSSPPSESTGKGCRSCKVQARSKSNFEKQPLQAADRADGRRLPVKL